jgi:simple sugar transport system permease protein
MVEIFSIMTLAAGIRLGLPILLAGMGEIFGQRSGVLNLGIEGMMAVGALAGFWGVYQTGNPWIGFLLGIGAGGLLSLVHALLVVTLRADQVISGVALTFFGVGLAALLGRPFVGIRIAGLAGWSIPLLSDIPVIGAILFQHDALVYITFILIPLLWFILRHTSPGRRVRAVGEATAAADTMGINVAQVRYLCILFGGMMAGLAGAYLTVAHVNIWVEGIIAGRGFMAVAITVFALWNPLRAGVGALLFGAVQALQLRLQGIGVGVPFHIMMMIPYLTTLIVLIFASSRAVRDRLGSPTELRKPYVRGER